MTSEVKAQEFDCEVEVNSSLIEGTDKRVFEELRQKVSDYINNYVWTTNQFSEDEKIKCRIFITVKEYSSGRMRGDLQIQSSRPVYNSGYTTTLLNFKDSRVEFSFSEGDELIHGENVWAGNLTGLLDYYSYIILGLDYDSFSPKGGTPYFEKASSVAFRAQSSGESGWRPYDDPKGRGALVKGFTDGSTSTFRNIIYSYHRKGLDEMTTSVDKGRESITSTLSDLRKIYHTSPQSIVLTIFREAKLDELTGIYSRSSSNERENVANILQEIYPMESEKIEKIRKGEY